jgi:Zn-dependent protease with chaperone function
MNQTPVPLPGLSAGHFTHPADGAALQVVRNLPVINFLVRKMFQYGIEKMERVRLMSDAIKVTPGTYAGIFEMTADAASRLGIPHPDVFVTRGDPNASTSGAEYPFVVVTTGLRELLDDDELYAILSHECGHIKAGHVLYLQAARFVAQSAAVLGLAGLPLEAVSLALLQWTRKAEFTADRAALLCGQNPEILQSTLMKLAGGAGRPAADIRFTDFVRQAEMLDAMTAGINLNRFYQLVANVQQTHPALVARARELSRWAQSQEYAALLAGDYEREPAATLTATDPCPHCGEKTTNSSSTHCVRCGSAVVSMEAVYTSAADSLIAGALHYAASSVGDVFEKASGGFRRLFSNGESAGGAALPEPQKPSPKSAVAEKLALLQELRDDGLITAEEAEERRRDILQRALQ